MTERYSRREVLAGSGGLVASTLTASPRVRSFAEQRHEPATESQRQEEPTMSYQATNIEDRTVESESGRWLGRIALEERPDGTWVMAFREASSHADNTDSILHLMFSEDRGESWSPRDTYLDGEAVAWTGHPPGASPSDAQGPGEPWLYTAPNGDLVMHCWHMEYSNVENGDGTWQCRSTDGGKTWTDWQQVDFVGISNDNRTYATDDYFVLDGVIYAVARMYNSDGSAVKTMLITSSDNGETWEHVSDITTFTQNSTEVGIEYVGNDTIVGVGNHNNREDVYRVESNDMGQSWTVESIIADTTVWDRPRIWTLSHLRDLDSRFEVPEWWKDDILIGIGNHEQNYSSSGWERVNAVWFSTDGGKTWSDATWFDEMESTDQDGGYADARLAPDGRIRMMSYWGPHDDADIREYTFDAEPVEKKKYDPPAAGQIEVAR